MYVCVCVCVCVCVKERRFIFSDYSWPIYSPEICRRISSALFPIYPSFPAYYLCKEVNEGYTYKLTVKKSIVLHGYFFSFTCCNLFTPVCGAIHCALCTSLFYFILLDRTFHMNSTLKLTLPFYQFPCKQWNHIYRPGCIPLRYKPWRAVRMLIQG